MDVVFASNDNYARHLAVSMCSLMDHNQVADRIRVFILSVNLSQENKEKLSMIAQRYAREIFLWETSRKNFPMPSKQAALISAQ